jgi:hypothetical protein
MSIQRLASIKKAKPATVIITKAVAEERYRKRKINLSGIH